MMSRGFSSGGHQQDQYNNRRSGGGMNRGGGGGQREPVPQAAQALRWSDPSTQSSYSDRRVSGGTSRGPVAASGRTQGAAVKSREDMEHSRMYPQQDSDRRSVRDISDVSRQSREVQMSQRGAPSMNDSHRGVPMTRGGPMTRDSRDLPMTRGEPHQRGGLMPNVDSHQQRGGQMSHDQPRRDSGHMSRDPRDLPMSRDQRGVPMSRDQRDVPLSRDQRDLPLSRDQRGVPMSRDQRGGPMSRDARGVPMTRETAQRSGGPMAHDDPMTRADPRQQRGYPMARDNSQRDVTYQRDGPVSRDPPQRVDPMPQDSRRGVPVARDLHQRGEPMSREPPVRDTPSSRQSQDTRREVGYKNESGFKGDVGYPPHFSKSTPRNGSDYMYSSSSGGAPPTSTGSSGGRNPLMAGSDHRFDSISRREQPQQRSSGGPMFPPDRSFPDNPGDRSRRASPGPDDTTRRLSSSGDRRSASKPVPSFDSSPPTDRYAAMSKLDAPGGAGGMRGVSSAYTPAAPRSSFGQSKPGVPPINDSWLESNWAEKKELLEKQERLEKRMKLEKEFAREQEEKRRRLEELNRRERELEEKERMLKEELRQKEEQRRFDELKRIEDEKRMAALRIEEEDRRRKAEDERRRKIEDERRRKMEEEHRRREEEQEHRRKEEQAIQIKIKEAEIEERERKLRIMEEALSREDMKIQENEKKREIERREEQLRVREEERRRQELAYSRESSSYRTGGRRSPLPLAAATVSRPDFSSRLDEPVHRRRSASRLANQASFDRSDFRSGGLDQSSGRMDVSLDLNSRRSGEDLSSRRSGEDLSSKRSGEDLNSRRRGEDLSSRRGEDLNSRRGGQRYGRGSASQGPTRGRGMNRNIRIRDMSPVRENKKTRALLFNKKENKRDAEKPKTPSPEKKRGSAFNRLGDKVTVKSRLGSEVRKSSSKTGSDLSVSIAVEAEHSKRKVNESSRPDSKKQKFEVIDQVGEVAMSEDEDEKERVEIMKRERQLKERLLREEKQRQAKENGTEPDPETIVIKKRDAKNGEGGKDSGKSLTVNVPKNLVGRLALKLKEMPKPAVQPKTKTDKEKEALKKKMKNKFAGDDLPERIILLALENVLFDENRAVALLNKVVKDDVQVQEVVDLEYEEDKLDYEADD